MPPAGLKTAILGLNDKGQLLLEAASKNKFLEIVAVADKNSDLAKEIATQYACHYYDDYRQLITVEHLDCLLVAAPIHSCDEYLRAAMKKKIHLLKTAPAARDFEESAELVRLSQEQNIKFAIATLTRFADSFLALRKFLRDSPTEHISLASIVCNFGIGTIKPWQSDPKLSGGGVLLHNCYDILDQLIWNFSLPQEVYSLNSNLAGDRKQRHYLTEDTAILAMKFSDNFLANLVASRNVAIGAEKQTLKIYTKEKVLTATDNRFVVSHCLGQTISESTFDDDQLCRTVKLLENFTLSILEPADNPLCSSADQNLDNMALIEAAYLSARTGSPEQPDRILEVASHSPLEA